MSHDIAVKATNLLLFACSHTMLMASHNRTPVNSAVKLVELEIDPRAVTGKVLGGLYM